MVKINLPVLVLKGLVLLPNNDIRLEFDNDISKNIIDVSELFHDNYVLIVSNENPLEETLDINNLPRIGVISKISRKMILPNGKVRVILTGINRAVIYEYLNHSSEILESIISKIDEDVDNEELIIIKLIKETEKYVRTISYVSNNLLSQIKDINSLSKLTDIIIPYLSSNLDRKFEYLKASNPLKRAEMILEDIYKEKELFKLEKSLDIKVKKEIDNTQKEFVLREKIKAIKEELGDSSSKEEENDILKIRIEKSDCPVNIKEKLQKELKKYQSILSMSPELSIVRNYIEYLLDMPWNISTKDNDDIIKAREVLNQSHYGLKKIKERIVEFLAVKKVTNSLNGTVICLVGPSGVGKTSLAKGIALAMNRKFVKISLGGVSDTSEIIGHRRTYIGADAGSIINSIKKAKSNNPVFLIDEIDKIIKNVQGDPASALLDVLDIDQNKHFIDNYVEEEFDLSNVLFILTANYKENIPDALKDRLEIIELSGYTDFEKVNIAQKYLIPNLCEQNGLNKLNINDETLLYLIRNYTKEAGVRGLKRELDALIRKIVTKIVLENKETKLVSIKQLSYFLGQSHIYPNRLESSVGVVNGLAYTSYGGTSKAFEVSYYKGNGKLILTGSLGEVMKESAYIALSYIKANYELFHINYDLLIDNDIHIHIPEEAVFKDGPSAGITLTTALISAFTNKIVKSDIAMTGEITLSGNVLPIGGLKEKCMGAYKDNIKKIIIPYDNLRDLKEISEEIKNKIKFIPIKKYEEIVKYLEE
ncbi:MAG: endopeptidase La [Bacilli bacterium]